jgi:dephospho-CoA kinase
MLNVALTGNIGAGKSTVAELFRRWGATVIDADVLVREAQAPGSPVLAEIARRFGAELVSPTGELDRAVLRARVLRDPAERAALNAIMHPEVLRRRAALLDAARQRGDAIVVSDIPLLFEVLDPGAFDAVVLVDAPEAVRLERILQRGLSRQEAEQMIAAQMAPEKKRAWGTQDPQRRLLVIVNDGTLAQLERAAGEVWEELRRRAAAPRAVP